MKERSYIAIDLKSFFASVECRERGLDPLTANLVVADASRTEKTICLAVSPSLKAYGIPGRPRLFEVVQKVQQLNAIRQQSAPGKKFTGTSHFAPELETHPELGIDYLVAPPRMAKYIQYSTQVYHVYLKYIAPEDIHVYSIDEVMMDVTNYLHAYRMTPRELAMKMILDVLETTGITATAGIGTNLYLCKVAMDIMAKHTPPDENGVRIAELTEESYRRELWTHQPLTDFWRVGRGYARKLEKCGLRTMGDIARCSIGKAADFHNEDLLYKLFGINAQLLIDHAWGFESCTIADIKAYRPSSNSIGSGQVLCDPYPSDKARLVTREMADTLSLELVDKGLAASQIALTVGYDVENTKSKAYSGPVTVDFYGRTVPKQAHGSASLGTHTASTARIIDAAMEIYDRVVDPSLLVRRLNIVACNVLREEDIPGEAPFDQLDLFSDHTAQQARKAREDLLRDREKRRQRAILTIKKKYGKNAIVKGMNLEEGATAMSRNQQIGGHKA